MNELEFILQKDINTILSSGVLSLQLMKIYSKTFLNGKACKFCTTELTNYYLKLKQMAKVINERTLVPNWTGIKNIIGLGIKLDSELITDEQAVRFITKGYLKESNFKVLPLELQPKKVTKKDIE